MFLYSFIPLANAPRFPGHVLGAFLGTRCSEISLASACLPPKLGLVQGVASRTSLSGAGSHQDPVTLGHGILKLQHPVWGHRGAWPWLPAGPLPCCCSYLKQTLTVFQERCPRHQGEPPAVDTRPVACPAWQGLEARRTVPPLGVHSPFGAKADRYGVGLVQAESPPR